MQMPSAVGETPTGPQVQPKKPLAPASGMPLASAPGGNLTAAGPSMTQQPAMPLANAQVNSPDPMAFAGPMVNTSATPNAPPIPATPPANTANPGASLAPPTQAPAAPTGAIQDWINYTPMAGKTEAEKAAALQANAAKVDPNALSAGAFGGYNVANSPTGIFSAAGNMQYKPDASKINSLQAIAGIDKSGAEQDVARGAVNAATQGFDKGQSAFDASTQQGVIRGLAHKDYTPEELAADTATRTATPFGEPTNNPNATPGLPAGYVPGVGVPNTTPGGSTAVTSPATPATAPATTPGGTPGVALSQINPDASLLSQQITPSNDIDRTKVFQDSLNSTIKNVIDPAYETSARNLNRYNFGAGRGVSGEARTSQGDLADSRERRIADLTAQGTADATRGSIDDMYRNVDELQQERESQRNLSNDAFGQSYANAQLEDALTNSAFNRADRQSAAGEAGNPGNAGLILSQIFGNQSSEAAKAAAGLFGGLGSQAGGGTGGNNLDIGAILKWLQSQGVPGGGGSPTAPTTYPDN